MLFQLLAPYAAIPKCNATSSKRIQGAKHMCLSSQRMLPRYTGVSQTRSLKLSRSGAVIGKEFYLKNLLAGRTCDQQPARCVECGEGCLPVGVVRGANALEWFERYRGPAVVVALHAREPSGKSLRCKGGVRGRYLCLARLGAS